MIHSVAAVLTGISLVDCIHTSYWLFLEKKMNMHDDLVTMRALLYCWVSIPFTFDRLQIETTKSISNRSIKRAHPITPVIRISRALLSVNNINIKIIILLSDILFNLYT